METREFMPQVLPASMRGLAGGVPEAPAGTVFALAADGGFAVPPRRFTLYFGRGSADVHVAIGTDDPYVSRRHGTLSCDGEAARPEWWLRNTGRLPIRLPGETLLLSGHEQPLTPGYTPLLIGSPGRRSHLLEVYVVGALAPDGADRSLAATRSAEIHVLTPVERLVLTALAQRYLRQERYPQPVSWKQVADDLNRAHPDREWTPKSTAHLVSTVRERLATGPHPVPGLLREDGVGEPVGNTLNHNLIQALLTSATLLPGDLALLADPL
ncbi:hypothetical protein CFP65_6386 [Kitasatospora sp. MMS16-BH015]|uniref:FHA domain-containing protein n=1 Tax=Kitasatospora sp. MMS16-BH015 TaxID=2018025 RepID=UPI000CA0A052|nr:FHA domain-containing protein [Kitasatospora sp. MMS16-BH015]AUG81042.1 hypothetical protein CFP65_6386 [Kitasatospora sp. MMS16-BH015]